MKPHIFVLLAVLLCAGMIVSPVCALPIYQGDVHPPDTIDDVGISKAVVDAWCIANAQYATDVDQNLWGLHIGPASQYNYPTKTWAETIDFVDGASMSTTREKMWIDVQCSHFANGSVPYFSNEIYRWCNPSYSGYAACVAGATSVPVASFTCTPTSQYPDEPVVCTDTSTGSPASWYWTITAESLDIEGFTTGTSQNFTWYSHYPGLYSVNLRANNSAGYDWENKTNYVSISANATPNTCSIPPVAGKIRSMAQCVDSVTNGAIAGCDLSLLDKEGGAWSNVTDRFDGTWCIDTYPGHHIDAYGWADDYTPSPSYRLNLLASDTVMYELLMHPGYIPPAADGKVWLYVLVNDADTGAALENAHVLISGSGQTSKSDYTGASGQVVIQWVNASTAYVTADKSGYTSGTKTVTTSAFGPDTVRIELHRSTVTPTATMTTGPGGTVPTTAGPWGTPGPEGTMPAGYTNAQGQRMMDLLAMHGYDLVMLCIVVTIMALLGIKLGK